MKKALITVDDFATSRLRWIKYPKEELRALKLDTPTEIFPNKLFVDDLHRQAFILAYKKTEHSSLNVNSVQLGIQLEDDLRVVGVNQAYIVLVAGNPRERIPDAIIGIFTVRQMAANIKGHTPQRNKENPKAQPFYWICDDGTVWERAERKSIVNEDVM